MAFAAARLWVRCSSVHAADRLEADELQATVSVDDLRRYSSRRPGLLSQTIVDPGGHLAACDTAVPRVRAAGDPALHGAWHRCLALVKVEPADRMVLAVAGDRLKSDARPDGFPSNPSMACPGEDVTRVASLSVSRFPPRPVFRCLLLRRLPPA
jgi:hypothetical protein